MAAAASGNAAKRIPSPMFASVEALHSRQYGAGRPRAVIGDRLVLVAEHPTEMRQYQAAVRGGVAALNVRCDLHPFIAPPVEANV